MKKPPEFPITQEDIAKFKKLIPIWQERLHLKDWRIIVVKRRPVSTLAEVVFEPDHRVVKFAIGRDWGSNPPAEDEVERIVIHELLHIRCYELAQLAEVGNKEEVVGAEHLLIVPLTETLLALSKKAP